MVDEIIHRIISQYDPDKIILFGSYAFGRPTPDSDIDLLIVKESSQPSLQRRIAIRKIIRNPHRKIPVETLVMTPSEIEKRIEIGDQFIQEIIERGLILYAA